MGFKAETARHAERLQNVFASSRISNTEARKICRKDLCHGLLVRLLKGEAPLSGFLGVSVCLWQTSCEPTEPGGETQRPKPSETISAQQRPPQGGACGLAVADGKGQGVGGVVGLWDGGEGKQAAGHLLHLGL